MCAQLRWELGSPVFGMLLRRYAPHDTYEVRPWQCMWAWLLRLSRAIFTRQLSVALVRGLFDNSSCWSTQTSANRNPNVQPMKDRCSFHGYRVRVPARARHGIRVDGLLMSIAP